jgi:hypothetical protein
MLGSKWVGRIEEAEIEMLDPYAPAVMVEVWPWKGARWRPIDRRVLLLGDLVSELWTLVLDAKFGDAAEPMAESRAMPEEDLLLLRQFAQVVDDLGILVSPRTTLYRLLRDTTRALLWSAGDPSSHRAKAAQNQSIEDTQRFIVRGMPRPEVPDVPRRGGLYLVR